MAVSNLNIWNFLSSLISFSADFLTVIISGIAIFLFLFKKKPIATAFKALLNYSFQITLSELRAKLDRLNELNANNPGEKEQIINIFYETLGQIRGNKRLKSEYPLLLKNLKELTSSPDKLNEHTKRSFVAELRESLKYINIADYMGG